MKKLLSLLMAVLMVFALVGCSSDTTEDGGDSGVVQAEVVEVTDAKSVDDKGFNENAWKGIKMYCDPNGITYNYYMPTEQTTDQYLAQIASAAAGGAKVIVCPGYLFTEAVTEAQYTYPDITFICVDFAPTPCEKNAIGVLFKEQESGFLTGYACVKEGLRHLSVDGAMAVPGVKNYCYGFLAGAEYAAKELGLAKGDVVVEYAYTGEFAEKPEYVTADLALYTAGVEVIFGCGSPRNSFDAVEKYNATAETKAWALGVDVDSSDQCEFCLTSCLKNMAPVIAMLIGKVYDGTFEGGQTVYYGIEDDGTGLIMDPEIAQFTNFTMADYEAIVAELPTISASLPTGYGSGAAGDYVNTIDYAKTLELVHVNITSDSDQGQYKNY